MKCVLDWGSKALTGIDGFCKNSQLFHLPDPGINNTNLTKGAKDKLLQLPKNMENSLIFRWIGLLTEEWSWKHSGKSGNLRTRFLSFLGKVRKI